MKKTWIIGLLSLLYVGAYAITPQELADSLSVFASERAYVGKVKVSDIQMDEKNITVTTCNRLASISLTQRRLLRSKNPCVHG